MTAVLEPVDLDTADKLTTLVDDFDVDTSKWTFTSEAVDGSGQLAIAEPEDPFARLPELIGEIVQSLVKTLTGMEPEVFEQVLLDMATAYSRIQTDHLGRDWYCYCSPTRMMALTDDPDLVVTVNRYDPE